MASAEKYAAWIVANADKRGTPEFNTVARAYQEARGSAAPTPAPAAPPSPKKEEANLIERIPYVGRLIEGQLHLPAVAAEGAMRSVSGILSGAFGARNRASDFLQQGAEFTRGLQSQESRTQAQVNAARSQQAAGKGTWEEIKAGAKNIASAPAETVASLAGSVAPYIGAGLAAAAAAPATGLAAIAVPVAAELGIGGLGGAGAVKESIYNATYEESRKRGIAEDQAAKLADEAQSYGGKFTGQLALGGVIGAAANAMGLPKMVSKALGEQAAARVATDMAERAAVEAASRQAAEQALQKSVLAGAAKGAVKAAIPMAAAAGQARYASNKAQIAAGADIDPWEGVTGDAATAAITALIPGAAFGRGEVRAENTRIANRQAALDALRAQQEQAGPSYGTFDVVSRDAAGKVQREQVNVISEPDAEGNVTIQRADGSRAPISLDDLKAMHAPSGSSRAVPIPDTLSRPAITQRLRDALGDFAPDEYLDTFIRKTADELGDAVVLGKPEAPEPFLSQQEGNISRKRKISEESRIGHSLVLDEARNILNEYTDLVTAPPEGAAPKMEAAGEGKVTETVTTLPSVTETVTAPPVALEEVIQNRAASMREENARRTAAIDQIANDPSITDKVGTFEDLMEQNGYTRPSPEEIAYLHDAIRAAAEHETALNLTGARVEDIHTQEQRQAGVGRINIIEDHLYDPDISPRKKIERINADLEAKDLPKLSEDEVNRYQAVADAVAAYGPKGERQKVLDAIIADDTIKNKFDAFFERMGEATDAEAVALDRATIEADVKGQQRRLAEPSTIERSPAPDRSAEIASEAEAANQRLAEAQARAEQSRAEVDRINAALEEEQAKLDAEPHKGTPGARQAINAIKDLEAERATVEEAVASEAEAATPEAVVNEAPGTTAGEGTPTVEELTGETRAPGEAKAAPSGDDVVILDDKLTKDNTAATTSRRERTALASNWRMSKWYKNLVYHFGGAKGADQALAKSMGLDSLPAELSTNDKFEMLATNQNGMVREINRRFINPIMAEVERLYGEGVPADDISDALQARAATQRNAKIAKNEPEFEGYGSSFSPEEAQAILTDLKLSGKLQKMGKVIKLHDALRAYKQELAVKNGLISREKMDQFIAEEPDYTPYKGWAKSGDLSVDGDLNPHADYGKPEYIRKPLGVNRRVVRKAEGRSTQAANSLFNLMADAQVMATKAARNKPGVRLAEVMEKKPEATADIATFSDTPVEGAVTVMRDGKPQYIVFKETRAGNAMKSAFTEMADPVALNTFVRHFMKYSGILRGVNTTFSPLFWVRAFRKDVKDMLATAYSEQALKDSPLYQKQVTLKAAKYAHSPEMHRAIWSYLRDTEPKTPEAAALKQQVAEMVEAGGSAGYAFREQAQDIEARMQKAYDRLDALGKDKALLQTKEGIRELANTVHMINDYVDIAPRFALYRAAVEAGVKPEAAAKIALESSLNLPRRGRYGTAIDAVKWYTNAGIQSVAKKQRMLSSANGRKVLAAHMVLGSAIAAWNIAVAGDKNNNGKNDYLELPAWRKAASLVIYSPDGKHAIPIPLGFMTSFETYFGQKMTELAYGLVSSADATAQLGTALTDVGKAAVSSQLPLGRNIESIRGVDDVIGLVIPDMVAPLEAIRTNKNAFGDAIYNEPFNKEQAKSSVPRASTPQGYKDWASWLNSASGGHGKFAGIIDTHPESWKYLIGQYLGGVGRFAASPLESAGKEFSVDESRASATGYYELSPRMRQVVEAFGPTGSKDRDTVAWVKENLPTESNPRVRGAYKVAEKALDAIKAREANLQKSKLPADQKQLRIDKIEADRQEAYARFLRTYYAVEGTQK